MQTDTAKRLCRLASKKTGFTVYADHSVSYHTSTKNHVIEYRVTYFYSDHVCEGKSFSSWDEAYKFLKQLALEGLPDVQEPDANAL